MSVKKYFNRTGYAFFLYIAVAMGLQFVLSLIVNWIWPLSMTRMIVVWAVSFIPMYLVAAPLCSLFMKKLPKRELYRSDIRFGQLILLFFMAMCLLICGSIIGTIVSTAISNTSGLYTDSSLDTLMLSTNPLILLLVVVIVGPIVEELLFRRLLIDRLIVFGDKAAIFISAFMFGIMHGNFEQLFYAFGVGLLFGYVYIRSGNLRYSIFLHMAVNFFGGLLSVVLLNGLDIYQLQYYSMAPGIFSQELINSLGRLLLLALYEIAIIGFAIAGLVLLIRMRKRFMLKKGEMNLTVGQALKKMVTTPGMLLYIAACAFMFVLNMWPY